MSEHRESVLAGLDPALNGPKRLAIMAVLAGAEYADFGFLREHLGVSDSDLSKQASALDAVGYLSIEKSGHGRGGSTRFIATPEGRDAYERHREALRALLSSPPSVDT